MLTVLQPKLLIVDDFAPIILVDAKGLRNRFLNEMFESPVAYLFLECSYSRAFFRRTLARGRQIDKLSCLSLKFDVLIKRMYMGCKENVYLGRFCIVQ